MNAILSAVIGILFYGIFNVILDYKFRNYTTPFLIAVMSVLSLSFSLAWLFQMKFSGKEVIYPDNWQLWLLVVVCGLALFLGDSFYLSAYKGGESIFALTTVAIMLPVSIAIFKGLVNQTWPNIWQVTGYILASLSVFLLARGSSGT